jgi:hypothetical protein
MTKPTQPKAALAPPAGTRSKTLQEKAERAIAIRESTAKLRKGKPMTFLMRRVQD